MGWRSNRDALRDFDGSERITYQLQSSEWAEIYADTMEWDAVPRFDPSGVSKEDIESWAEEFADANDYEIHDVYDWMYGYADDPGG